MYTTDVLLTTSGYFTSLDTSVSYSNFKFNYYGIDSAITTGCVN